MRRFIWIIVNKFKNVILKFNLMIFRGVFIINCLIYLKDKNFIYLKYYKGD